MKKRRLFLLLVTVILCLAGCNDDEAINESENKVTNEGVITPMGGQEEEVEDNSANMEGKLEDESVDADIPIEERYTVFDRLPEWDNLPEYTSGIQIDDTLYVMCEYTSDFLAKMEASSVSYTSDYNPDSLIDDYGKEEITVYRDGIEWFYVTLHNPWDEVKEIKEVIVDGINISENAEAYCRVIDGRRYEEVRQMTYNDVIKFGEEEFLNKPFKSSNSKYGSNALKLSYQDYKEMQMGEYEYRNSAWAYNFYIDKATNCVLYLEHGVYGGGGSYGAVYSPTPRSALEKFSDITDEEYEELIKQVMQMAVKEDSGIVVVGSYLLRNAKEKYGYSDTSSLVLICEDTQRTNEKRYMYLQIDLLGKNDAGELVFPTSELLSISNKLTSETIKSRISGWNILDTALKFQ